MSDFPIDGIKPIPADAPPNRGAKNESKSEPRQNRSTEVTLIIKSLEKTYTAIGMGLMIVNPADATVVVQNAGELAESWRHLLENNPKVRKQFMKMMEASGWSAVIVAHAMVAVPIFNNHKESFDHLVNKKSPVQPNRVAQPTAAPTL